MYIVLQSIAFGDSAMPLMPFPTNIAISIYTAVSTKITVFTSLGTPKVDELSISVGIQEHIFWLHSIDVN